MKPNEYIKHVRKSLGINQTDFARLLFPDKNPQVAQSYVSRYERGEFMFSAEVLLRLQALDSDMQHSHNDCQGK